MGVTAVLLLFFLGFFFANGQNQTEPQPVTPPKPNTAPPPPPLPISPTTPPPPSRSSSGVWPGVYVDGVNNNRTRIGDWLLTGCWSSSCVPKFSDAEYEYEGYDGWYNNIARPDSGAIDRPLLRRWPAAYEDGSYLPAGSDRPNPLKLSQELLSGGIGTQSKIGRSALFVFFGQQVVEEILDAQRPACPPEYFNIPIPDDHTYKTDQPHHTMLPLLRTRYDQRTGYSPNNPRQQLNEITPYFDGGLFYGITKQWSDQLRTYENGSVDLDGCLASSHGGLFPEYNTDRLPMANPPPPFYHSAYIENHQTDKVSRFFKLGNPRGNENSFLLTFGVMWFRWHNYLAKRLRHFHPRGVWTSEKVYNEARKWVIATQQKIVFKDWLPLLTLENLANYTQYDPSIDPQIDQFFQSAAFRFGHTLVVPGVYLRDYTREGCKKRFDTWGKAAVRTCNIFWRPHEPLVKKAENTPSSDLIDIDRLLMGMSVQLSEREDHEIVEDLRGNVFGPLEFPRRDLMAVNIQRGRDHGLPDFNTAREAYGLKRYTSFDNFTRINETIRQRLIELYKDINKIDVWIGGILETGDGPGELFKAVIMDQFRRIRDGDRFWYENKANKLFTKTEIERINQITIYDVIMAVTKMDPDDIPRQPFHVARRPVDNFLITNCTLQMSSCTRPTRDCFHLEQLNQARLNESCLQGDSYDYFRKSEVSYILTFTAIGAFVIGSIGAVFLLIKLKEDNLKTLREKQDTVTRNTFKNEKNITYPLFVVHEWTGPKASTNRVVIVVKEDIKQLEIMSQAGSLLRAIDFSLSTKSVEIYQITDAPYLIIKCEHSYDLVVQFDSEYLRENFLKIFDPFLTNNGLKRENITTFNLSTALKKVVTKADRQKLLERFYRVVFAQAFKIKYSKREILRMDERLEKEIANTELTVTEFAEAMSMRANDEFVLRMFSLIDKDKNGFISFREFVDLLIIFANGTETEKAKLLFDMYDIDGTGYLTESSFIAMIRSFLATVGGKVNESELHATILDLLERSGVTNRDRLDFNAFLKMFGNDIKNLSKAKLNFKGVRKQDRASYLETARDTIENIYSSRQEIQERLEGVVDNREHNKDPSKIIDDSQAEHINHLRSGIDGQKTALINFIELKSKEIFWMSLYTLVMIAIFAERAYYYSVEREHSGLRRIAGYGVTVTRGAASAIMFTYSSLLPPFLYYFFLGPVILFTLDSLISISRKKVEIPVIRAEILPSDVTMLEFRKPENFQYKSGQWIRIACLDLNRHEYHPFTLSSSPDEDNLTLHIRSVGPWTTHIRRIYDNTNKTKTILPKIYLDGPYGEGHQDWNQYDISVLIGGGIGVTPFASILKDIVYKSNQTKCKKVYFIWVSRTQKHFEWFVDLIREVEYKDKNSIISCHIFITQFFEKFDLRTIFLYICERHYQRISNRSLFTNLKAVTHFGRPSFPEFFNSIGCLHGNINTVGVFSCGPPSMTTAVDRACNRINIAGNQSFEHHYKNF